MTKPTTEYLNKHLSYDSETGRLCWQRSKQKRILGVPLGKLRVDGRRVITIDYVRYLTAQLVWVMHTGAWPTLEIDHINQDKADDRIENLREATHSENNHNKRVHHLTRGTYKRGNKWRAMIKVDKKVIHLGYFNTQSEASAAYEKAAYEYFGEFACIN